MRRSFVLQNGQSTPSERGALAAVMGGSAAYYRPRNLDRRSGRCEAHCIDSGRVELWVEYEK